MDLDILLSQLFDYGSGPIKEQALKGLFPGSYDAIQGFENPFQSESLAPSPEQAATTAAGQSAVGAAASEEDAYQKRIAEARAKVTEALNAQVSENQQQEFLGSSLPIIEDYDKGIGVGINPGVLTGEDGMPGAMESSDDVLQRIRAQAIAKGKKGSLRGGADYEQYMDEAATPSGGSFSQGTDSPENLLREAANKRWMQEQPMRDAYSTLTTPEIYQRDPQAVDRAAQLMGMQQNQILGRRQDAIDQITQNLADGAGKVPFEQAQALSLQGFDLPWQIVGESKEQVLSSIESEVGQLQNELQAIMARQQSGLPNPTDDIEGRFGRSALMKLQQLQQQIQSGQLTPDEAKLEFRQMAAQAQQLQTMLYTQEPQQPGPQPTGE